ncbi:glycosyltransferase [Streptomyces fimbriatus]
MRVLVTAALPCLLHPLVPLAWALRTAGHEVRVVGRPQVARAARTAGLVGVETGDELTGEPWTDPAAAQAAAADPVVWSAGEPARAARVLAAHLPLLDHLTDDGVLQGVVAAARDWRPELVLWDAHALAGPVAARAAGAAQVRVLSGPDHWGRLVDSAAGQAQDGPDPLSAHLAARAARHQVACDTGRPVLGDATVDPLPACLHHTRGLDHRPVRAVPYDGPATFPAWLRRQPRRPRLLLTLGEPGLPAAPAAQTEKQAPHATVADVFAAVDALDVEVVATMDTGRIPPGTRIPHQVRLLDRLPAHLTLPHCAAVVHDGAPQTLVTAAACGVPQLALPAPRWGTTGVIDAVERAGAGLAADPAALKDQLTRLLEDPGLRSGAARLKEEAAATPSPRELVAGLEELAARVTGRPAHPSTTKGARAA